MWGLPHVRQQIVSMNLIDRNTQNSQEETTTEKRNDLEQYYDELYRILHTYRINYLLIGRLSMERTIPAEQHVPDDLLFAGLTQEPSSTLDDEVPCADIHLISPV